MLQDFCNMYVPFGSLTFWFISVKVSSINTLSCIYWFGEINDPSQWLTYI